MVIPEAVAIRSSVFRGLGLPKKRKFARRILGSIRQVTVRTPAGLHVGKAPAFDVDLTRLNRVVARVTRGLYWHHHDHQRLPDDHDVIVWSEDGLKDISPTDALQLRRDLVDPVLRNPVHSIGRDVLRYRFARGGSEPVTAWLFEFYGDVRFGSFTPPKTLAGSLSPRDHFC